ncbi:MAG: hypothetical protein AAF968_00340 [Pseudomonadota bacterium]
MLFNGSCAGGALLALTVLHSAGALAAPVPPIPFRPDEAVLACQARGMHALAEADGAAARPQGRFQTDRMPPHMWHVSGRFSVRLDGEDRLVAVDCDVSSSGVEVFTMEVMAEPAR